MKKVLCFLFMALFAGNQAVLAMGIGNVDPGAINSQYVRDLRTFEARERMKDRSAIIKSTKETDAVLGAVGTLKSIKFVNNNNFSEQQLTAIVQDKLNQPMTGENLADIRKKIMRFYQSEGFFSAVAVIVSDDNQTGNLVIEIKEGPKNSIILE